MLKQIKMFFLFSLFCFLAGSINAQEIKLLTSDEMIDYVDRALNHVKEDVDQAIKDFNAPPPNYWTQGEIHHYRFMQVIDCETNTILTHPFLPQFVGKAGLTSKLKDLRTKNLYLLEMCEDMKNQSKGKWYRHLLPAMGAKPSDLTFFVKRLPRTPYIILSVRRPMDDDIKKLNAMIK